jgi:hypothetical protein
VCVFERPDQRLEPEPVHDDGLLALGSEHDRRLVRAKPATRDDADREIRNDSRRDGLFVDDALAHRSSSSPRLLSFHYPAKRRPPDA